MTQPTMEEVAGWLREAAFHVVDLADVCLIEDAVKVQADFNARAAQVDAMGWRPIEEAPKGERILLWAKGWRAPATGEWAETGFSHDGEWENEWSLHHPTNFMPLPKPPVTK